MSRPPPTSPRPPWLRGLNPVSASEPKPQLESASGPEVAKPDTAIAAAKVAKKDNPPG